MATSNTSNTKKKTTTTSNSKNNATTSAGSTGSTSSTASASTLETLLNNLSSSGYTKMTDAEMAEEAKNKYSSVYEQKRTSANQAYETTDLALQQELEALQSSYDDQRESSIEQYLNAYSQAARNALSRGMQRSSYTGQTLANIATEGAEALQDINEAQTTAEGDINEKRSMYAEQLATQLASYDTQQLADELAYIDELESREYERWYTSQNDSNALALNIYNAQYTAEQDAQEQANWQAEYDYQKAYDEQQQENWEKEYSLEQQKYNSLYSNKSSGSGSSSSSKKTTDTSSNSLWDYISSGISSLFSGSSGTSTNKHTNTKMKK